MFKRFRRRSRWGICLQPDLLSIVESQQSRGGTLRFGRQLHLPLVSDQVGFAVGGITPALKQAKAEWQVFSIDVDLAVDDEAIQQASLMLPAWLQSEDLEFAIQQAWDEQLLSDVPWALDYFPQSVDEQLSTPDGLRSYRVFGMPQSQLDALRTQFEDLGLKLLRVQPRSLALFRGVRREMSEQAPDWLFELRRNALMAVGLNAQGEWVSQTWRLGREGVAHKGLAVTQSDGTPWWAEAVLEQVQPYLEEQTGGRTWQELSWALQGGTEVWHQAFAHTLGTFLQGMRHVGHARLLGTQGACAGVDAKGALWTRAELRA